MDLISLLRLHKYYLYYFSSTTSIFHHHLFLSIRRNFYQIIKDISRNSHNPIFQFLISNRVQTPLRPSWFKRFLSDDSPLVDNFINIQNHRRSSDTLIIKGRMVIKAPNITKVAPRWSFERSRKRTRLLFLPLLLVFSLCFRLPARRKVFPLSSPSPLREEAISPFLPPPSLFPSIENDDTLFPKPRVLAA